MTTVQPHDSRLTFSARMGSQVGVKDLAAKAKHAEDAGFDQFWTGNDLFGTPGIISLAAIAMSTERIKFGSGVIDPVSMHPAQIAQIASGLQDLSNGRFLLGIGAGSEVFYSWGGITAKSPVVRTREGVLAIRELVEGRSPAGVEGVAPGWLPQGKLRFSRPTPIYIGAMGPKMLALTGRIADGALPLCLPPRHVFGVVEQIKAGAEKAGRSMDDIDVAACLWVSIAEDRDEARWLLAKHIAEYSGSLSTDALAANGMDVEEFATTQQLVLDDREDDAIRFVLASSTMMDLGIVGGPTDVIDQCGALIDAGVKHVSFGPPMGPDAMSSLSILGAKVFPALRTMFA
jgi:5,10-methylenetetrahydromethanopterin reductase